VGDYRIIYEIAQLAEGLDVLLLLLLTNVGLQEAVQLASLEQWDEAIRTARDGARELPVCVYARKPAHCKA
jgi:hypothetical protein